MPLALITPPVVDPVTLAEVKLYLRQEATFEDETIQRMIQAATRWIEQKTWRALREQTLELRLERFPSGRQILLPRPRLIEIVSIEYLSGGAWATLAAERYEVDATSEPGRLQVDANGWPDTDEALTAVKIRYEAGYAATEFPGELRQALLMLVSAFYTHREGLPDEVRNAVELLIGDYCLRSLEEIPYLRGTSEALLDLAARESYGAV